MHRFKVPRVFGLTIMSWYFCKMLVDYYVPWFVVVATCGFCYACLVLLLSLMWYLPVVQSANSIKYMFHLAGRLLFIWYFLISICFHFKIWKNNFNNKNNKPMLLTSQSTHTILSSYQNLSIPNNHLSIYLI